MSVSVVFPSGLSWFLSFAALRRDDGGRERGGYILYCSEIAALAEEYPAQFVFYCNYQPCEWVMLHINDFTLDPLILCGEVWAYLHLISNLWFHICLSCYVRRHFRPVSAPSIKGGRGRVFSCFCFFYQKGRGADDAAPFVMRGLRGLDVTEDDVFECETS